MNALGFLIVLLGSEEDCSCRYSQTTKTEHMLSWFFVAFNVNCNQVMFLFIFVLAFRGAGKAIKGVRLHAAVVCSTVVYMKGEHIKAALAPLSTCIFRQSFG